MQLKRFRHNKLWEKTASDRLQVFLFTRRAKLLIQTFFDDKIQRILDGTCRDKQVYARIAEKLGEAGNERTTSECKNKINNLKRRYLQYPA